MEREYAGDVKVGQRGLNTVLRVNEKLWEGTLYQALVAFFSRSKHRALRGHGAEKHLSIRPQGDGFVREFFCAGTEQEISFTLFAIIIVA